MMGVVPQKAGPSACPSQTQGQCQDDKSKIGRAGSEFLFEFSGPLGMGFVELCKRLAPPRGQVQGDGRLGGTLELRGDSGHQCKNQQLGDRFFIQ